MKILFVSYLWKGAKDWSYKEALEKAGHEVSCVDIFSFFPNNNGRRLTILARILNRLVHVLRCRRFNDFLVKEAVRINPELIITFKAKEIFPSTLKRIRKFNTSILFNVSTDDIYSPRYPSNTSYWLRRSVPLYHCIFTNKPWPLRKELIDQGAQRVEYLQFAFDPSVIRPIKLSSPEQKELSSDVVFIGSPEKERIEVLEVIAQKGYKLRVYGPDWHRFDLSPALKACVVGRPVYFDDQAKVLSAAKIALVFVRRGDRDLTNTRVFETPGSGVFMLSERNLEISRFYKEGEEIECFSSPAEACEKIDYYINHDKKRVEIASAGHKRALSFGYDFSSRVKKILEVFQSMWMTDSISR